MGKPVGAKKPQSQKYNINKDGSGFTNIRKKKTINSYKKLLRKEKRDDDLYKVIKMQKRKKSGIKVDTYTKVHKYIEEKQKKADEERLKRQEDQELKGRKIQEAKAAAAEKRRQRQKLFSKKTRKGQPYLHNQMTLLLEKIEKGVQKESKKHSKV